MRAQAALLSTQRTKKHRMADYAVSVDYYVLQTQLNIDLYSIPCVPTLVSQEDVDSSVNSHDKAIASDDVTAGHDKGNQFSIEGPSTFKGVILAVPDLLWSEDVWTPEKEQEANERLKLQGANVPDYWRSKYEKQAGVYWHQFYKRHSDHFFKDRHYLHVVFPELLLRADHPVLEDNTVRLLEVGCGVGNAVIPLLDLNPNLYVVAVDFAKSAIEILSQHPAAAQPRRRLEAHVVDAVNDPLPLPEESLDLILCMFVVSAIAPKHHNDVFAKLFRALKPGGKLLFRDYGR